VIETWRDFLEANKMRDMVEEYCPICGRRFACHEFTFLYEGETLRGFISRSTYSNSSLAVMLTTWYEEGNFWEPFATLSVNTDLPIGPDEFVASHNCTELVKLLAGHGLFEATGRMVSYGYVKNQPIFRLTDKGKTFAEVL
jgi:hypothetical protein